jgi:DNA transformation protein and related proteins
MPATAFVDFLLDQLDAVPDVRAQAMFGGRGLYSGDLFFGIVFNDILYFKVNDQNRSDYLRAGMAPFKPYRDRPMTMQYYQVPAAVMEDADELHRWALRAIAAAADKKAASTVRRAGHQTRPRSSPGRK